MFFVCVCCVCMWCVFIYVVCVVGVLKCIKEGCKEVVCVCEAHVWRDAMGMYKIVVSGFL